MVPSFLDAEKDFVRRSSGRKLGRVPFPPGGLKMALNAAAVVVLGTMGGFPEEEEVEAG